MAFAQTGLFLGYLSLYLMQEVIRAGSGAGPVGFRACHLGLSSFGIYLGRFLRWNRGTRCSIRWTRCAMPLAWRIRGNDPRTARFFGDVFSPSRSSATFIVYSFTLLHGWVTRAAPTRRGSKCRLRGAAFAVTTQSFTLWTHFAHSSGSPFFSEPPRVSQCFYEHGPTNFSENAKEGIRGRSRSSTGKQDQTEEDGSDALSH